MADHNYEYRVQSIWLRDMDNVYSIPHATPNTLLYPEWGFVNTTEGDVFETHTYILDNTKVINIRGLKAGLYICNMHVNWSSIVTPTSNIFAQYIGNGYGANDSMRYGYTPYDAGLHTSMIVSGYPGVDDYSGAPGFGLPSLPNFTFTVFQSSGAPVDLYQYHAEIHYFGTTAGFISMNWRSSDRRGSANRMLVGDR